MNINATPTAEPTPSSGSPALRKIFFGSEGLRAGWSLLIFVAVCATLAASAGFLIRKTFPAAPTTQAAVFATPHTLFLNELLPFLITALVSWIMSRIERRPVSAYGLGGRRKLPHFLAGLGWGFLFLSLLVFTLHKTGLLVFDRRLIFGAESIRYGASWLLAFVMVGFLEEYLTRGYVLYTLTRGLAAIYRSLFKTQHSEALGFWTSALVFSFLFGFIHSVNPGESPIGLFTAGFFGFVFCLSIWRTGSLWWAIGFHASWDWAQSFLYGVADSGLMIGHHLFATHPVGKPILSGGTTGPEGSIFVLAIFALICLVIVLTLPRTPNARATVSR